MKKNILLTLVFTIATMTVHAQLQKGDLEIGFSTSYSNGTNAEIFNSDKFSSFQAYFSLGEMVNERVMLGAGFRSNMSSNKGDSFFGDSNFENYSLHPFARYYFLKRSKLHSFGFIGSSIGYFNSEYGNTSIPDSKGWSLHAQGGFGAQYFIAPNLAVHAEIGTFIFENKYGANNSNLFFTNLGVRTLVNNKAEWEGNLKDRYLKKGNFVLSGNVNLVSNDVIRTGQMTLEEIKAKSMKTNLSLLPEMKYFVKDKFAVSASPGFTGSWNGYQTNTNYSLGLGFEAYLPIGDYVFFVPSVDIYFAKNQSKYFTTEPIVTPSGGVVLDTVQAKESFIRNSGKADFAIKHFANDAIIFSIGGYYSLNNLYVNEYGYNRAISDWGGYSAIEYFFLKNISFSVAATYARGKSRFEYEGFYPFIESQGNKSFTVDLLVKYFIFR